LGQSVNFVQIVSSTFCNVRHEVGKTACVGVELIGYLDVWALDTAM